MYYDVHNIKITYLTDQRSRTKTEKINTLDMHFKNMYTRIHRPRKLFERSKSRLNFPSNILYIMVEISYLAAKFSKFVNGRLLPAARDHSPWPLLGEFTINSQSGSRSKFKQR